MHEAVLPVIAGMAVVTYATRASGLLLGRRLGRLPWLENVVRAMPGAIIVSLVAPEIVSAGVAGIVAAGGTVAASLVLPDNLLVPMAVGVLIDIALKAVR